MDCVAYDPWHTLPFLATQPEAFGRDQFPACRLPESTGPEPVYQDLDRGAETWFEYPRDTHLAAE